MRALQNITMDATPEAITYLSAKGLIHYNLICRPIENASFSSKSLMLYQKKSLLENIYR
jgi:hypothetical protein